MPNNAAPSIPCPNCQQPMQTQTLEQNYHGTVCVDLCFSCAGIWFDHQESVLLAPVAVIELFKEIHSHLNDARQPVATQLHCPRCRDALELGYDLSKSGKFSYYRCLRGDGRFTPFFQFLREKHFVRSLTEVELGRVRAEVQQVRCSECGAPIDLQHSSQCQYCHAPVSFLDPDAVEKAMQVWTDAENRRHSGPSAQAVKDALARIQLPQPVASGAIAVAASPTAHLLGGAGDLAAQGAGVGLDLVVLGIRTIGRLFGNGR
jgi:hypothetical protein